MKSPRDLVKAGVHWGHLTSRWCPRMAPYIWGFKNGVHLIDVSKTALQLQKAADFINKVTAEGKTVLWVGTKKPAQDVIRAAADRLGMPYVNHRWIGGTLNNWSQVKKSITKSLHYEDVLARAADFPFYTKKDLNSFNKSLQRLLKGIGGIRKMTWPIGAIVLVDVSKEATALREAVSMNIPVIALVDTNGDPSLVDYVIPANDDTPGSIKTIIDVLADAAFAGKEVAATKKAEATGEEQQATDTEMMSGAEILTLEEGEEDRGNTRRSPGAGRGRSQQPGAPGGAGGRGRGGQGPRSGRASAGARRFRTGQ